jgi:hypothetical protein
VGKDRFQQYDIGCIVLERKRMLIGGVRPLRVIFRAFDIVVDEAKVWVLAANVVLAPSYRWLVNV